MAGIQRIKIMGEYKGHGAWRFEFSEKRWPILNHIYQHIFGDRLEPGVETLTCTKEEKFARYDIEFGVDVILNLKNGMPITVQEKILSTDFSTVTVEYMQNKEEKGDWFNLKCDLYFVAYSVPDDSSLITRWILLNWNQVKLCDTIPWRLRENKKDGARANFRFASFSDFPDNCIIARSMVPFNIPKKKPELIGHNLSQLSFW